MILLEQVQGQPWRNKCRRDQHRRLCPRLVRT